MHLPRRWTTAGHNRELWGDPSGTYKSVPYDALPPLQGPFDGSFAWLRAAPSTEYGMTFEQQPIDAVAKGLAARAAEAEEAGLALPLAFTTFITEADLYTRVPSCTACYYELAPRLIPVPEHPGPERLLRFLNDQQTCYAWYLLLEEGGGHQVVRAAPVLVDEIPPTAESLEDMTALEDIEICASNFEEFIKRFWIENTIWFAVRHGEPLEGELRWYSEAAKAAAARM